MLKSITVCIIGVFVAVATSGGQEKSSPVVKGGSEAAGEFEKLILRMTGDGGSFFNVAEGGLSGAKASQEQQKQEFEKILEAPDDWGAEQIPFPLSFAPSIKFNGYEDIRFAPGWSQPDSPEFWTYKMVWQIDEDPQLTEERVADLIQIYFDGLSRAVAQEGGTDPNSLQKPVAVFLQDSDEFRGRLRIYDAFTTKDWICLNARVQQSKRGDKHLVTVEMSPKPFDHEVWTKLKMVCVKKPRGNLK